MSLPTAKDVAAMVAKGIKRKGSRNERPGEGQFRVVLKKYRKVAKAEKVQTTSGQVVEVDKVSGYVLTAKVLESTCPQNPVGADVDIYFRQNGVEDWAQENDDADIAEFAAALVGCWGFAPASAEAGAVIDALFADERSSAGIEILFRTFRRKKDADKADPFLMRRWTPVPNAKEKIVAYRAEFASLEGRAEAAAQ